MSTDTRYWMPAEWYPHEATLLTWPHDPTIWRGEHPAVERCFARFTSLLTEVEDVHISVPDEECAAHVRKLILAEGGFDAQLHLHLIASNDVWARDHGPTVVLASTEGQMRRERVWVDWDFNAWGDKYDASLDRLVCRKLAAKLGARTIAPGIVLEGGSIEVNGCGDLLTTTSVLLNPNRNPGLSQAQLEARLRELLGVENIIWLGDGITGDDTDGHIDDISRFVDEGTILTVLPDDESHPDYAALYANLEILRAARSATGNRFEVRTLPMPEPVVFGDEMLPASYANFYIANGLVCVPIFEQESDARALQIIQACFADHRVVGIDARALVSQYGALHCVSQQLPLGD